MFNWCDCGKPNCKLSHKRELPKPPARVRILTDDDGHDYVIPVGKEDAFQAWVNAGPYREDYHGEDFAESALGCALSCYSFGDFQEDN
jgi:hypothetical protein